MWDLPSISRGGGMSYTCLVTSNGFYTNRTSDGSTRRLWYKLGRAHDFEAQQAITFRGTWRLVFGAHHIQGGLIFLWASALIFQLAWQGCYESWCASPNLYTPLAHAVRDPHFGLTSLGPLGSTILGIRCCSGLYQWLFTLGFRWTSECILAASFLAFIAFLFLTGFVTHTIARHVLRPVSFWFRNLLARIKHNAIGLLGVASIGFAGHIIHVALPASRGLRAGWMRLLTITPTPLGLKPLLSGNWAQYAVHPDRPGHLFGALDPSVGTAILTFTGSRSLRSDSLWLSDIAHHHLALGIICILIGHLLRVTYLPAWGMDSLHFQLAIGLAALGTASSFTANHLGAFPVYAYLTRDLVSLAAIYTHHQYVGGFFL